MSHETFMDVLRLGGTLIVVLLLGTALLVFSVAVYASVRSFLNKERIVRQAMRQPTRQHRDHDDLP